MSICLNVSVTARRAPGQMNTLPLANYEAHTYIQGRCWHVGEHYRRKG